MRPTVASGQVTPGRTVEGRDTVSAVRRLVVGLDRTMTASPSEPGRISSSMTLSMVVRTRRRLAVRRVAGRGAGRIEWQSMVLSSFNR